MPLTIGNMLWVTPFDEAFVNKLSASLSILMILPLLCPTHSAHAQKNGIVIDTVIATVNDSPITLVELGRRLSPPRVLTVEQASSSQEARSALDGLIYEKVLIAEAERRNIRVSDGEIESYIGEVAQRNSLSPEAFEKALKDENRSIEDYKNQIRFEILRSKIAANYVRVSAAVTDEEVEKFIQDRMPTKSPQSNGTQIALRQIMLRKESHTSEQAKEVFAKVLSELESGASFESLAPKYSEAPDAQDGGNLGLMSEKDLSPEIFDAVVGLDSGKISNIVSTPLGFHLFQVVDRQSTSAEDTDDEMPEISDELRSQVRKQLEREKLQMKMATFFESEIMKQHTIEKKI